MIVATQLTKKTLGGHIRFFFCFSFPQKRDRELCERWLNRVARNNIDGTPWRPTEFSKVCSDHFKEDDFVEGTKIRRLKPDAVPSVFPGYPRSMQCTAVNRRPPPKRRLSVEKDPVELSPRKKIALDHTYSGPPLEQAILDAKSQLKATKKRLAIKYAQVQVLSRKVKRRDKKLSTLMEEIKSKNMITEEQLKFLRLNFNEESMVLIENEFKANSKSSKGMRYSEELKSFAVTMHFYSSQAYSYLRKFFTLPHPSTIRKWASSINCLPGFLTEVLASLKGKVTPDNKDVAIIFDAMSIKSAYQFDRGSSTYVGSVNYGHLQSGCDESLAKEALVFMAVGLKKHFKVPIAYFLIDKLSASTQAQIVKDAVILLTEAGHCVRAVVCDGNFTNQSTAEVLGCRLNVNSMITKFKIENITEEVHFVFDVCHLLKNVRNCLKEYGPLVSDLGTIDWHYIEELHKLQQHDNLVLANKLTAKHVNFENHKMNVKLAAQTLSNSVACAIDFARLDLKLKSFEYSDATTDFIRRFDALFDVCNSKSPIASFSKAPINANNLEEKIEFLNKTIEFIVNLADISGKDLVFSRRKTGFVGFICSIKSIISLSTKLLEEGFRYFLTYKLSQDHLEMFFSRIRRRQGWNNNPTPLQFKWSLRMLLLKNGVLPSAHGNCEHFTLSSKVFDPESNNSSLVMKHNYPLLESFVEILTKPSVYHENSVFYISGYICRKVAKKVQCTHCCKFLMSSSDMQDNKDSVMFTKRKDKGGLIYSPEMFKVICAADRSLRIHLTGVEGPVKAVNAKLMGKVFFDVIESVGSGIFPEISNHSVHVHSFESEDSHVHQIIKEAVKLFVQMMLHHHEKLMNERYVNKNKTSSRHKLNKTILFLNQ